MMAQRTIIASLHRMASIYFVIACCLALTDVVSSQVAPSPVPATTAASSLPAEVHEGSGDVDPGIEVKESGDVFSPASAPHVVVTDPASGRPCLLATLNATMQVSYQVQEGLVHQTYLAVADIQLPEDVESQGICGENTSSLFLYWGSNATFTVNMTFTRKEGEKQENATWSMTSISISYDLSNREVFPGASESSVMTVERHNLALFPSAEGYSYVCDRDISCHVGSVDTGVDVTFHEVQLAAFGVTSSEFPTASVYCTDTDDSNDDDDYVVPLIVACCLSALVVVIVIGYVISRKVQERREQTDYRPMP